MRRHLQRLALVAAIVVLAGACSGAHDPAGGGAEGGSDGPAGTAVDSFCSELAALGAPGGPQGVGALADAGSRLAQRAPAGLRAPLEVWSAAMRQLGRDVGADASVADPAVLARRGELFAEPATSSAVATIQGYLMADCAGGLGDAPPDTRPPRRGPVGTTGAGGG